MDRSNLSEYESHKVKCGPEREGKGVEQVNEYHNSTGYVRKGAPNKGDTLTPCQKNKGSMVLRTDQKQQQRGQ